MAQVIATITCRSVSSHAEAHTRNASVSRQMVPAPKLPTCLVFFFFLAFPLLLFAVGNGVRLSCILPPGIRVEQRCRVFLCGVPAVAIFFWPNINHSHLFILDFQFSQKKKRQTDCCSSYSSAATGICFTAQPNLAGRLVSRRVYTDS